jgi:hypothetical protein
MAQRIHISSKRKKICNNLEICVNEQSECQNTICKLMFDLLHQPRPIDNSQLKNTSIMMEKNAKRMLKFSQKLINKKYNQV